MWEYMLGVYHLDFCALQSDDSIGIIHLQLVSNLYMYRQMEDKANSSFSKTVNVQPERSFDCHASVFQLAFGILWLPF